jgi:diadenosine tetraphosphatase ApaH/serine/threonine PP2A family protein phosphatase
MKIAVISDIHGNIEALDSVFRDIDTQGVEKIHFLGDAVGYGCNPNECIKKITKYCDIKLLGNHDYAAMGLESTESFNQAARASMEWTQSTIKPKNITSMADYELEADFLDFHLVHASPDHPDEWHYILDANQASGYFDSFSQSVCLVGHSHIPVIFRKNGDNDISTRTANEMTLDPDSKYIINVGSVGQPRDNDNRACYLVINTDDNKINYRRVKYNLEKTQEKMRKAKLPDFLIERLAIGV